MDGMTVQRTKAPVPLGEHVPDADQRIVLFGQSWDSFERLLEMRGERPVPRMAYLDGAIELMSPSSNHESIKSFIGHLFEQYCYVRKIQIQPVGSWLLKRRRREAGLEPDECYVFGREKKRRPDLAIEVVWTSGGIDKLEIYRRLEVSEVWFWKREHITVYELEADGYRERRGSRFVPDLELALLCRLAHCDTLNDALDQLHASLGA